jgi:hypothetical protein
MREYIVYANLAVNIWCLILLFQMRKAQKEIKAYLLEPYQKEILKNLRKY